MPDINRKISRGSQTDDGPDTLRPGSGRQQGNPAAHRAADQNQGKRAYPVNNFQSVFKPYADCPVRIFARRFPVADEIKSRVPDIVFAAKIF